MAPSFERGRLPLPRTGDRIGPYLVEERIGEGGMGIVYAVRREGDPAPRSRVAVRLAQGAHWAALGRHEKAFVTYEEAARLGERHPGDEDVSDLVRRARLSAAWQRITLGDYAAALELCDDFETSLGSPGEPNAKCQLYMTRGQGLWMLGRRDEAADAYERSAQIARQLGDADREMAILANLGILHQEQGRFEQAERAQETCVEATRTNGNKDREQIALLNLGNVLRSRGRSAAALALYDESLALLTVLPNRSMEATILVNVGGVLTTCGDFRGARRHDRGTGSGPRDDGPGGGGAGDLRVRDRGHLRVRTTRRGAHRAREAGPITRVGGRGLRRGRGGSDRGRHAPCAPRSALRPHG